jgi:hypothetical protein
MGQSGQESRKLYSIQDKPVFLACIQQRKSFFNPPAQATYYGSVDAEADVQKQVFREQ